MRNACLARPLAALFRRFLGASHQFGGLCILASFSPSLKTQYKFLCQRQAFFEIFFVKNILAEVIDLPQGFLYWSCMETKTEQAKRRLREMAERSSVTAVAKDLGISQQLLYRFLHVPGAGISLRTYDKIEGFLINPPRDAA